MNKRLSSIIAIVIGVAIIIIGTCSMGGASAYNHNAQSVFLEDTEFGADFYTYIYEASYKISSQLENIDAGIEKMIQAEARTQSTIATVMICIGLAVIAFGLHGLATGSEQNFAVPHTPVFSSAPKTEETFLENWRCPDCGKTMSIKTIQCNCGYVRLKKAGDWVCTCGKNNSSYVSSCSCGKNKRDIR